MRSAGLVVCWAPLLLSAIIYALPPPLLSKSVWLPLRAAPAAIHDLLLLPDMQATRSAVADELDGRGPGFEELFLSRYWQKKPVLVRQYIPAIHEAVAINSSMLLELSLDEDVESRIIAMMRGKWKKKSGPFRAVDLDHLPPNNWTLLVQEVDRHIPAVADLWGRFFSFIPTWRRDDIMISYAREGGGIGAHVDNYDVFLLQARGRRRWSIENAFLSEAEETSRKVPHVQTRLLKDFRADQSWELNPGDMLYLPPRVPHQGVSLNDECITVSMGFRAPSYVSLCSAYVEFVCRSLTVTDMYVDPDLTLQRDVGAVASTAVERLRSSISSKLEAGFEEPGFSTWLGQYLTTPLRSKPPPRPFFLSTSPDTGTADDTDEEEFVDEEDGLFPEPLYVRGAHSLASQRRFGDVAEVLAGVRDETLALRRAEGTRAACIGDELFIDGRAFALPPASPALGPLLCGGKIDSEALLRLLAEDVEGAAETVLLRLLGEGLLYPVDRA